MENEKSKVDESDLRPKEKTLSDLWRESDSVRKPLHELFDVKCRKCGSDKVGIYTDDEDDVSYQEYGGCQSCGSVELTGDVTAYLALKCEECGNAKVVLHKRDVENRKSIREE